MSFKNWNFTFRIKRWEGNKIYKPPSSLLLKKKKQKSNKIRAQKKKNIFSVSGNFQVIDSLKGSYLFSYQSLKSTRIPIKLSRPFKSLEHP